MVKLQQGDGRWNLTVPKDAVEHNGWQKGKKFLFSLGENGKLNYTPLKENQKPSHEAGSP